VTGLGPGDANCPEGGAEIADGSGDIAYACTGATGPAAPSGPTCSAPGPGANLVGCNLSGDTLTDVNLSGANLTGADLQDANLTGADLEGANLVFTILVGADLTDVNFDGANLTGASIEETTVTGDTWDLTTCPDGGPSSNQAPPSCV